MATSDPPRDPCRGESDRLLLQNKAWAQLKALTEPGYFDRTAEAQTPRFLWIGCSDSRVPADAVTATKPGELFVHRNIANLVVHTDLNLLSVVEYAVNVLKVEHIIVCGHYGCGGVRAAMGRQDLGMLNMWLNNIRDVYGDHYDQLRAISDPRLREDRLVELTTRAQLKNLMRIESVQRAWQTRSGPWLHAWCYRLHDGVLNDLDSVAPGTPISEPYRYDAGKPTPLLPEMTYTMPPTTVPPTAS